MKNNEDKIKLVLLVGDGHSGSTLLDLIMDSHSKILGVGEISHYKRMRDYDVNCACGKIIRDCNFWNKAVIGVDWNSLPLIGRNIKDFIFNPLNFVYFDDENDKKELNDKKYIKETEKLYRNALRVSGKEIVFDSSKSPDRAELLIQGDLFDVVLLHLVRDGRGVVYSHIKLGRKPLSYMKQWAVVNLRTKIVKIRNKDIKNIFILYEDFVKNPVGVTSYILEQIGLEFESNMLNFNSYEHHQVGGNARLKNKKDTSEIKFDIKWKKQMALRYKIIFDLLFGWLNVFYKIKPKKYEKN